MKAPGKRIEVQKHSKADSGNASTSEELACLLAYHYPQYTYLQAKRMPQRRVLKLLRVAKQKEAEFYLNMTNIAAAPHTKKGIGVKKLQSQYRKLARGDA